MLKTKKISLKDLEEFHKEKFLPGFLEHLIVIEDKDNLKVYVIPGQVFFTSEAKEIFESRDLEKFLKTFSAITFKFHRNCLTGVSVETPSFSIEEIYGDSDTNFTNCRYCKVCNINHYYSVTNLNWSD